MVYVRMAEKAWKIIKNSWIMYLTDMWFTKVIAEKYTELVQTEPTKEFYEFIAENMNAVLEGKSIADEIEPVIMNLIDDKMNKRKLALRTGDYIALQRFFQRVRK